LSKSRRRLTTLKNQRAAAAPPTLTTLPDFVVVREARAVLRTSRAKTYAMLKSGELAHVRFGRMIRIPKSALAARPRDLPGTTK
jgi:excisionase family DNA binding protein